MTTRTPTPEEISEVAKAQGSSSKGSTSAQMQSELAKKLNNEQNTAFDSTAKPHNGGGNQTQASLAISEVAKAEAGTTKRSLSAQMQSEMTKRRNAEQGTSSNGNFIAESPNQASHKISEFARAEGGTTKGSIARLSFWWDL